MSAPGRPSLWLVLPVFGAGLVITALLVAVRSSHPPVSVDQVEADIHAIALHRSGRGGVEDGGAIGPWWIAASAVDVERGLLLDFRLRSDELRVAARQARLVIDPDHDTFSFELLDAVLTRFPNRENVHGDHGLLTVDRYVLGPVEYGREIRD